MSLNVWTYKTKSNTAVLKYVLKYVNQCEGHDQLRIMTHNCAMCFALSGNDSHCMCVMTFVDVMHFVDVLGRIKKWKRISNWFIYSKKDK